MKYLTYCSQKKNVMIHPLGKDKNITESYFEPKEGERSLLPSDKGGIRSPSLDLEGISENEWEEEINKLAEILLEGFIYIIEHEERDEKKGSHLLPSINKGTS